MGYLETCLESLASQRSAFPSLKAIVVDNGSPDSMEGRLTSWSAWTTTIRCERPKALAETHNRGLDHARTVHRATHILVLNDDTRVGDTMLATLLDVSRRHPHSLCTPLQLSYEEPYVIDAGVVDSLFSAKALVHDVLLHRSAGEAYAIDTIVGAAIFGELATFDAVGPFDCLFPFYGVDEDYCRRAKHLGVSLLLTPHAYLYHAHGRFQDSPKKDFNSWFFRWTTHQYARMLLVLKDPARPLHRSYVHVTLAAVGQAAVCLVRLWPRGAAAHMINYFRLVRLSGRIARSRRAHYRDRSPVTPGEGVPAAT